MTQVWHMSIISANKFWLREADQLPFMSDHQACYMELETAQKPAVWDGLRMLKLLSDFLVAFSALMWGHVFMAHCTDKCGTAV